MTRTLVFFSLEAWDGVWRRNQYFVDGLLRADPELRVVFVEPPRDVLHDLVSRRRPQQGRGERPGDARYRGRLTLIEPTKWLPRLAGPASDGLLRASVARALDRAGEGAIIWVNDPDWAGVVARRSLPALYDMTDDWLASGQSARVLDRIRANEKILFDRCAAIVVCSEGLRSSRLAARPDLVLIPNAVDVDRYRVPTPRPDDLPNGPVALYVGTLHEDRVDVGLLIATGDALNRVGGSVVLVGPSALTSASRQRLEDADGVVLLGERPYEQVPAYLQHAEVLIVPHSVNEFTESLDPIKLYEYLAVGRPVVSTPVAGFRQIANEPGVSFVSGANFVDLVCRTATTDRATIVHDAIADWDARVEDVQRVLEAIAEAQH